MDRPASQTLDSSPHSSFLSFPLFSPCFISFTCFFLFVSFYLTVTVFGHSCCRASRVFFFVDDCLCTTRGRCKLASGLIWGTTILKPVYLSPFVFEKSCMEDSSHRHIPSIMLYMSCVHLRMYAHPFMHVLRMYMHLHTSHTCVQYIHSMCVLMHS